MSVAGIRSNLGDGYQTLVAFEWALMVLSNPDFLWIEVDSINYSVDDVVVGKTDDHLIACQCKKNHPDFKAWTLTDLGAELDKAFLLLSSNPQANVRFYSRSNFGELAKLKEHRTSQSDAKRYEQSLGIAQHRVNETLSNQLVKIAPELSTFEFLSRTNFITTSDLDQMEQQLRERLQFIVSNPDAAFNALWVSLDKLGARMEDFGPSTSAQHRLTKNDLRTIVQQAGSFLVPPMELAAIRRSFSGTSSIGRAWRRHIAGQRIVNPVIDKLLIAVDARKRAILLTGLPGSGKTCVMLELQEILEERAITDSGIQPLFIQSREFADVTTPEERQAQGLSLQWVEEAARLAENTHVVIIIDSLDVLSIAREHRVLQYFLAQVDRLLLIPNLTVVTACRDFDRHYDRRIAERHWDCEFQCPRLEWDTEVAPLLAKLSVTSKDIDGVTRELISNPRELALFVELAMRGGSFNAVTSQALAQRYLDAVVLADSELGDGAVRAVEAIASEMLQSRSLVIPHQRFNAAHNIRRKLCSLNVLQETQDGKLTFGHQTLLDVLVISHAIRNGVTLNAFINDLPPVPFVRPSIRSFISQLAQGDRREFRKQLRTVLVGKAAFHIRRLVAESFAEYDPQDEDWSFIRDLRENYRDVFQAIYARGGSIEWHRFWIKFLVPFIKINHDTDGLEIHVHRIAHWCNEDTPGVVSFWLDVLELDWFDGNKIADHLSLHLSRIQLENMGIVTPLLKRLFTLPQSEHFALGRVIAGCVEAGVAEDALLWRFVTDDVSDEDVQDYRFNNKLRCQSHEFGHRNDNFFRQRMVHSCELLDLAIGSVENWSRIRATNRDNPRSGYRHGFLGETSYDATHSKRDLGHIDASFILFDAIEAAISHHATVHSGWWQKNRERLCFNSEGSLLYFGILACTASSKTNIDLIGRILCDRDMLKFEIPYEIGELIRSAFHLLAAEVQDAVMTSIMTLRSRGALGESDPWELKGLAEFIVPVPCHLRNDELQTLLDNYERTHGTLIRQPYIYSRGGWIAPPFSYEVFLSLSNKGVLHVLHHYDGHTQRDWDDFHIGGESAVGNQLQSASSRQPSRFVSLLSDFWQDIPPTFRENIMNGVTTYLAQRYGNLRTNETWTPLEEPDATVLATQVIEELERHPAQWRNTRTSAKALEACAHVIQDLNTAERLIFLAVSFSGFDRYDPFENDLRDLINSGINMVKGNVAEALMILTDNFLEEDQKLPDLLVPALHRFALTEHPSIRALMLRRLPFVQSKSFHLGWDLFHNAMKDSHRLWNIAERCLYYAYHSHFDVVKPLLLRLYREGNDEDHVTWGRISALCVMTGYISFDVFITDLNELNSREAWQGAANVWANMDNFHQHRQKCLRGLDAGLNQVGIHAIEVARQLGKLFNSKKGVVFIPIELVVRCFAVFENETPDDRNRHHLFSFNEWLNAISQHDAVYALSVAEIYLTYSSSKGQYMFDHNGNLTQLMTRLFAEAEESEESDCGSMLQRVVTLQDVLLSMGVEGVSDWLKAAERP
ncbi:ATP-binding protein [Pantoea rodasii]|uniref:ATP-binding protein n=1 Tax=Pantoea rodasii TaxID=1076549 RepID=A0A2M9WH10_9GAMM|nr:ATP-binding protein [Pantoea rodasii]ORM62916.1 hypothetical protein HA45_15335 [Pantoea rodasii]PJZ06824.1 ATP-binding protein [Pantoea rodasii]